MSHWNYLITNANMFVIVAYFSSNTSDLRHPENQMLLLPGKNISATSLIFINRGT